jgi:hypothetical protein
MDTERMSILSEAIVEDVSVPLKTLKNKLNTSIGISESVATISKSLKEMNYSIKRVSLVPESQNIPIHINLRETYCSEYLLQDEKIIYIDEFGKVVVLGLGMEEVLLVSQRRKNVRVIRNKNISVCDNNEKWC